MDAQEGLEGMIKAAREAAHSATYLASLLAKLPAPPEEAEARVHAANRAARAVFALDDAFRERAPEDTQTRLAREALAAAEDALRAAQDALWPQASAPLP